ncbi:Cytochrome c oxidase assembly protein cox18, mitochondrial, partial [Coemansia biformis]
SVLESIHDGALLPVLSSVFSDGMAVGVTPWWAAICGTAVVVHLTLVLPLKIYQKRTTARAQRLEPAVLAWRHSVHSSLRLETRGKGMSEDAFDKLLRRRLMMKQHDLMLSQGCHPVFVLLLPLTQFPIWISITAALRHLCGCTTWLVDADDAVYAVASGMRSEGALWFTDLAMADPTCGLSAILVAASVANVVLSGRRIKDGSLMAIGRQKSWLVRTGTVLSYTMPWVIGWISLYQPAALVLYWTTSSSLALVENMVFQNASIRRALKFSAPTQPPRLPVCQRLLTDQQRPLLDAPKT